MIKYTYIITNEFGESIVTGEIGSHSSSTASDLLGRHGYDVFEIQRDKQAQNCWLYTAQTDKGTIDVEIR